MTDAANRWASPKEVAALLGVDERTVRRWAENGLVQARVTAGGRLWRIAVAEDGWPLEAED